VKILLILTLLFSASAEASEIEAVPFVKQESRYCGPASLASVMSYYGREIDQRTIGDAVYCEGLKGSLITDLEAYARKKGFRTRLAQGSIDDIKEFVEDKRPVIVLVDMGFWIISKPHYLVVTGVMDSGITAHSGYRASQTFGKEEFENIWKRKGSVYLLIHP
jgi:ABC-type bacteriocin/lantibiotic exporter with double-glycine peptidase domain